MDFDILPGDLSMPTVFEMYGQRFGREIPVSQLDDKQLDLYNREFVAFERRVLNAFAMEHRAIGERRLEHLGIVALPLLGAA